MNVTNNDITSAASQCYVLHLSQTDLLTAGIILCCTKTLCLIQDSHPQNDVYSPAGSELPPSHLTSRNPIKSNLYLIVLQKLSLRNLPYKQLLMFYVSNRMSIFRTLCRLPKYSVRIWGSLENCITMLCLKVRKWSPKPYHLARWSSLVGCPRLLIQCIHSYSPLAGGRLIVTVNVGPS
jgi:hypothetical protein